MTTLQQTHAMIRFYLQNWLGFQLKLSHHNKSIHHSHSWRWYDCLQKNHKTQNNYHCFQRFDVTKLLNWQSILVAHLLIRIQNVSQVTHHQSQHHDLHFGQFHRPWDQVVACCFLKFRCQRRGTAQKWPTRWSKKRRETLPKKSKQSKLQQCLRCRDATSKFKLIKQINIHGRLHWTWKV